MLMSRKAISPILATLLLIVIAVAAVVVTYAWVMTFTGSQTNQAGIILVKENVSWVSGSSIAVVVRNTGTSNGKITAVYIGTSSANLTSATVSPSTATVNAGASQSFTITYTWAANTQYTFKFITDTPAYLQFSEKSP